LRRAHGEQIRSADWYPATSAQAATYADAVPELPEVETTRRLLHPDIVGRTVAEVIVERPDRMLRRQEQPDDFRRRLVGRRIEGTARHGKRLLILLDDDLVWIVHLGMSGRLTVASAGDETAPHTHVLVTLDDGSQVRFIDPRTFGYTLVATQDELDHLAAHGPDAWTDPPSVATLSERLAGRTAPIKALLLDQTIVAGVGNIYADEALFAAGIDPHRPGGSLSDDELAALLVALHGVLGAGIDAAGTTLDDLAYLLPDGSAGEFMAEIAAYGREGEPCPRCGDIIQRDVVRSRSTFWSPGCQR
jgi:formamidopyrimidine-DNA glycosylase